MSHAARVYCTRMNGGGRLCTLKIYAIGSVRMVHLRLNEKFISIQKTSLFRINQMFFLGMWNKLMADMQFPSTPIFIILLKTKGKLEGACL